MQLGYVGLTINLQNMRNQTIWNLIVMIVRFGFLPHKLKYKGGHLQAKFQVGTRCGTSSLDHPADGLQHEIMQQTSRTSTHEQCLPLTYACLPTRAQAVRAVIVRNCERYLTWQIEVKQPCAPVL
jgi:hypothetical protein